MTPDEHDELCCLMAAQLLIADPETWTKGAMARNEHGHAVFSTDPGACRWCAVGACRAVMPNGPADDLSPAHWRILERIQRRLPYLDQINDVFGHESVLAHIDSAIAQLEAA